MLIRSSDVTAPSGVVTRSRACEQKCRAPRGFRCPPFVARVRCPLKEPSLKGKKSATKQRRGRIFQAGKLPAAHRRTRAAARQSGADAHGDAPGRLGREAGDAVTLVAAAAPFPRARALAGSCPLSRPGS